MTEVTDVTDGTDHTACDPSKKHRHDIGCPDHGAASTESLTRAIQGLMLLLIAASGALLIYAVVLASR